MLICKVKCVEKNVRMWNNVFKCSDVNLVIKKNETKNWNILLCRQWKFWEQIINSLRNNLRNHIFDSNRVVSVPYPQIYIQHMWKCMNDRQCPSCSFVLTCLCNLGFSSSILRSNIQTEDSTSGLLELFLSICLIFSVLILEAASDLTELGPCLSSSSSSSSSSSVSG